MRVGFSAGKIFEKSLGCHINQPHVNAVAIMRLGFCGVSMDMGTRADDIENPKSCFFLCSFGCGILLAS